MTMAMRPQRQNSPAAARRWQGGVVAGSWRWKPKKQGTLSKLLHYDPMGGQGFGALQDEDIGTF
jgi:hypothetical protein